MGDLGARPWADTLHYPQVRVDELLGTAARTRPDAPALEIAGRRWSYAELDAAVDRTADVVSRAAPPGSVVAVASILDPAYAIGYYAVLRAGLVVLPLVPMLREPQLAHVLGRAGARVALLTADLLERVSGVRAGLPLLGSVFLLHAGDANGDPVVRPTASWATGTRHDLPPGRAPAGPAPAALHFTSGTTGLPKCAVLTHANVTANAVQVAHSHGLGPDAVSVVSFPTYHPMHLNSAVVAGAHQVLHTGPDPLDAVALAGEHRATHLYTVPVRLVRLAGDRRLSTVPRGGLDRLRLVGSGGSALPSAVADDLAQQLGVPVVQGYGLAETAPLTHMDDPSSPSPGTVGHPLPDTECRIVDLETGTVLPRGGVGEVQVRGPQVMAGYRRPDAPPDVGPAEPAALDPGVPDEQGWFATGDVGVIGPGERLRLVDRVRDVFKYDDVLVSPTEIEDALVAHPAVADCAVLDRPDDEHGAVAHALVVLADGVDPAHPDAAALVATAVAAVNADLPAYARIRHAEPVGSVPRSPTGKVQRRELRHSLHSRLSGGSTVVVLVNRFSLTASPEEFERVFAASSAFMTGQPGFRSHTLVRSLRNPHSYVNIAHWDSAEAHQQVVQGEGFQEHIRELSTVARAEPDLYAVVQDARPGLR